MVIDTSAVVAIFLAEPGRDRLIQLIDDAENKYMSAVSVLETGMVLESRGGERLGLEFDLFLNRTKAEIVAVDAEQAEIARDAWRKYGKGRHAAALNFGDCLVYALAKVLDDSILAVGRDFAQTDITVAPL
ncbi:MAG TPA: type II toxin-antitoxin system VapC family toxin [Candidatus Acidoferrales bacterium]|nr:type II toxin-antitoxin system VapC family toxin [Candidatus Acidoferrales bacterium]